MEVIAKLNNLRIAPRKVRLVTRLLQGKSVVDAEQQLQHIPKAASQHLLKLLRSAKANAKNNFSLDTDLFVVKKIFVNEGMSLKRYMPKAHGSADVIKKRSSHITLVLEEPKKTKGAKGVSVKSDSQKKDETKQAKKADIKHDKKKAPTKSKKG